jgi:hypothetical protein
LSDRGDDFKAHLAALRNFGQPPAKRMADKRCQAFQGWRFRRSAYAIYTKKNV